MTCKLWLCDYGHFFQGEKGEKGEEGERGTTGRPVSLSILCLFVQHGRFSRNKTATATRSTLTKIVN